MRISDFKRIYFLRLLFGTRLKNIIQVIASVNHFERSHFRVPTVFLYAEGNTVSHANDKELPGPAESETLCLYLYTLCRKP